MAKEQPSGWYALDVDLEPAAREAVEYGLMEAGALGTETRDESEGLIRIAAYFAATPDRERVRNELFEALRIYNLPSSSVRDMNVREVAQRDWLEEWKQNWQPVEIGRFIIAPPWSNLDDVHDRLIIRIEPGMAFGTGILAIAAAKLFPEARIEACDTDEVAVAIACENATANGVLDQIDFRAGSIEESTASADLVCANLTADTITQIMPSLVGVTCGKLVLSGILETQIEMVQAGLHDNGIDEFEIEQDGEWVALIV